MDRPNECRTCGHCCEVHDRHGMKRCYQEMGEDYSGFEFKCDCNTGFIPADNLEYLEWEYRRKGEPYGTSVVIKSSNQSNENMPTE